MRTCTRWSRRTCTRWSRSPSARPVIAGTKGPTRLPRSMSSCRNCKAELARVFVDLGTTPLSNSYVSEGQLDSPEPHFPLRPYICEECLLVQLPMFESPEAIFG